MAQQPATDKQLGFIKDLATKRQYPSAGQTVIEASILERINDALGDKPLAKGEASMAIDYLLSRPRVVAGVIAPATKETLADLPPCKYAVDADNGAKVYVEVVERKGGRRYLNRLLGAPGDWQRIFMGAKDVTHWAAKVRAATYVDPVGGAHHAGPKAAAIRFSREFKCCSACGSPLSDPESEARGMGPICAAKF